MTLSDPSTPVVPYGADAECGRLCLCSFSVLRGLACGAWEVVSAFLMTPQTPAHCRALYCSKWRAGPLQSG